MSILSLFLENLLKIAGLTSSSSRPQQGHDHRSGHSNLQESQLAKVDSDAKEGAGRNDDQGPPLHEAPPPVQDTSLEEVGEKSMLSQIVCGCINSDGSIYSGTGFTVHRDKIGIYTIVYNKPFSETPAVMLTQNYRAWNDFGFGEGATLDNCVLVASDYMKCKVATGNSEGQPQDRNFTFIAILIA